MEQPHVGPTHPARPPDAIDHWAAFLGTALTLASLGLVGLADFGWFRLDFAIVAVIGAVVAAAVLWRPPLSLRMAPSPHALVAAAILAVGAVLIAPGSENLAGPRDQAVYLATGFAIARGGSTIIDDAPLRRLSEIVPPGQIDAWIYRNAINGERVRFPAQLFIRDFASGTVEGGFLPMVPVWIALAASLGGLEPALHVAGAFGLMALVFVMLACRATEVEGDRAGIPVWPVVGAILALGFSQVWWARESMAEAALGAFTWLCAWACIRWIAGGGRRWALLAGLAAICALFTRADGVLLVAALALIAVRAGAAGRGTLVVTLGLGVLGAGIHYGRFAPTYTSTVYGEVTLEPGGRGRSGDRHARRADSGLAEALPMGVDLLGVVTTRRGRMAGHGAGDPRPGRRGGCHGDRTWGSEATGTWGCLASRLATGICAMAHPGPRTGWSRRVGVAWRSPAGRSARAHRRCAGAPVPTRSSGNGRSPVDGAAARSRRSSRCWPLRRVSASAASGAGGPVGSRSFTPSDPPRPRSFSGPGLASPSPRTETLSVRAMGQRSRQTWRTSPPPCPRMHW